MSVDKLIKFIKTTTKETNMVVSQLANKTRTIDIGTIGPAAAASTTTSYYTSWATDSTNHVNFSNELLTDGGVGNSQG